MIFIGFSGGVGDVVCQPVVDDRQSGSAGIPQPCYLNRGRLAGKYRQAIFRSVTGKIYQNVNAVFSYPVGNRRIT